MTAWAFRSTSRFIFILCGLTSLVTAVPYAMLRGIDLPYQSEWVIFVVVLGLVGIVGIGAGLARRAWIAKICKRNPDDKRLFSWPLRLVVGCATLFYAIAAFAYFAPHNWNIDAQLMLALCPLYLLKMTFDPSAAMVFFLLAPMNAAVYGSIGLALGYIWLAFGARTSS